MMLDLRAEDGQDGPVALSEDDDLLKRGRAIFERLRTEHDPEQHEPPGEPPLPEDQAAAGDAADEPPLPEETEPQPAIADTAEGASPVPEAAEVTERPEDTEAALSEPLEQPADAVGPGNVAADVPEDAVDGQGSVAADVPAPAEPEGPAVGVPREGVAATPAAEPPATEPPATSAAEEPTPTPEPPPAPPVSPTVRPLPRIMAIANQKGGVGKTTTAVNLGASLAELGYRVLVIDLDPQGNATTGLGINPRTLEASVYDVIMHDANLEDCIEPTSLRNLFVVPATIDLAGAEIELVPAFSRELKLRRALDDVAGEFDYTLIDCPPSLGLITVNGLAAATEVVVPIQCEYYALEGLGQLLRNVNLVQSNLNPKLEVSAIILTMFDARTKLADQVAGEVRAHFGDKVCRNIVPRTVRLSEAPSFGQPIIVFDPSSRGAIAYRELAKEVSGGAPQRAG
jgi:chromosome partitioning protein